MAPGCATEVAQGMGPGVGFADGAACPVGIGVADETGESQKRPQTSPGPASFQMSGI